MRVHIKDLAFKFVILLVALPDILGFFGLTARDPLLTLDPAYEERVLGHRRHRTKSSKELCNMMSLRRRQKRLCRRGRGMAATLVRATKLSIQECQHQFHNDRWNCSLGKYRSHILDEGIRETSFLYGISSAGLVHELSRACAMGTLDRCTCDDSGKNQENAKTWRWGGCGDNLRFGLKFTRKFLRRARTLERDIRATVDEHNSQTGIKTVRENANTTCKCHGVSGSCTVSTCWLQLAPFKKVGTAMKAKYEVSAKVITLLNEATGATELMKKAQSSVHSFASPFSAFGAEIVPVESAELVHINDSPNFCVDSPYSAGTSGRSCIKGNNCDSICCGRGSESRIERVTRSCKCVVIWCCEVKCKECVSEEKVFVCK